MDDDPRRETCLRLSLAALVVEWVLVLAMCARADWRQATAYLGW